MNSIFPGVHRGISNTEYHADSAISKSKLWNMRKSPAYFKWAIENKQKQTDSMAFGSAVHTLFLEPENFDLEYIEYQGGDRRGKEWESFKSKHEHKTIMKTSELEPVFDCVASIQHHKPIIHGGEIELTAAWIDQETGILCKCRPDVAHQGLLIDMKTTSSIDANDFARDAVRYGYDLQAFMYCEGIHRATGERPSVFYFLVVENTAPYLSAIMRAPIEMMASGEVKFRKYMRTLANCIEKDSWPGPEYFYIDGQDSILINWPSWA
ncbi:MAG: PD-(D/E)XK nuclease-like domain-containing protein [Magnetococcales bacterium]|nr:PD-(D/E)XK nuclease-like domain-containing protein [Magnetococcales bacterium]